jgi:hypothetical protein
MRCIALAVLLCCFLQLAATQRLTGNMTSGITCTTDATNPFGTGCPKGEGCCSYTNTCVKISSCADFTKACPPSTCGKDLSFSEVTCAADVTKVFRSPRQLKCYESRDTICSSNETAMIVACRSSAGARGAQLMVMLFAASLALVLMI